MQTPDLVNPATPTARPSRFRQYTVAGLFLLLLSILPCWSLGYAISQPTDAMTCLKKLYWSIDFQLGRQEDPSIQTRWRTIQNSTAAFLQSTDVPSFLQAGRWYSICAHGGIQRLLGRDYVNDPDPHHDIARMRNGCLTWGVQIGRADINTEHVLKSAENLRTFKAFLDKQGIPVLFVVFPHKIHCRDSQLPRGVADAANPAADLFLEQMKKWDIPCFDAREILAENPTEHYRLFQQFDHHWKQEYAILTFQHLASKLHNCGITGPPDVLSLEPYSLQTRSQETPAWDGSQIRRVGSLYCSPRPPVSTRSCKTKPEHANDLVFFDSETAEILNQKIPNGLSPEEETQTRSFLKSMQDDFAGNLKHKLVLNHRLSGTNGKKLLLIKDSFAAAMLDILARSFRQVDEIDLRNFNRSAADHVLQTVPDLVIISYNPDCIAGTNDPLSPQLFDFMSVSTKRNDTP